MNKEEFIKEFINRTNYTQEKSILINNILEDNFIIGKKSKEKIINDLKEKLFLTEQESEYIYEISMDIISKSIIEKLKHPFKSKD